MCNRIKKSAKQDVQKQVRCAKTSKMCKNSIWDLINSNINKRDERDVQTGCTAYVHIAAIRMMQSFYDCNSLS